MDVILLQDVDKVGLRGEVVSVARGYMRNYLGPRRLAEEATPARVAELQKREMQRSRHEAASFEQAQEIADRLAKGELRFDVNELFTDVRVEVRTLVVPEGGELPPEEELEALATAEEEAAADQEAQAEREETPAEEQAEGEIVASDTEGKLVDPSAEPS
jgi:hypothetical protein